MVHIKKSLKKKKRKSEIGVILLHAKDPKDCQQTIRSEGRSMKQILSHSPQKEQTLPKS